jgi:uncharacterized protein YecE (DUF72 family)
MDGKQYLVGIGGWEHEVLDHCLYPSAGASSAEKLSYFSRYFSLAEIRPTFWDASLNTRDAQQWITAVSERSDFRFVVKLHSSFTHKREITPSVVRATLGILESLQHHRRLGTVLAQFPYAFSNIGAHRFHLEKLASVLRGFPVHIEFRHSSWDQSARAGMLNDLGFAQVSADLPRVKQFMPFVAPSPGTPAYVRLHGRNEKGWLLNTYDVRYDYLYNARELAEIKRRVTAAHTGSSPVMVVWNNTTGGKAVANALQLIATLSKQGTAPIPPQALRAFPHLHQIARPEEHTGSLFEAPYRHVG